ncbi:hypothetical protein Taro_003240 [Colocasia esculenta]|uniref:Jacalin-type lectin domain-containing protein n=1 Tax=Colocasia esculenta TaxID=4460 RepID=A0A843TGH9_COLES|nr:hypothetical protein [Colocasia esculenta]
MLLSPMPSWASSLVVVPRAGASLLPFLVVVPRDGVECFPNTDCKGWTFVVSNSRVVAAAEVRRARDLETYFMIGISSLNLYQQYEGLGFPSFHFQPCIDFLVVTSLQLLKAGTFTQVTEDMSSVLNGDILIKIGPRGDVYSRCDEWDEVCYGNVQQILITHGKAINSIQMAYDLNGTIVLSHRHGGDGDKFDSASFPYIYISSSPPACG